MSIIPPVILTSPNQPYDRRFRATPQERFEEAHRRYFNMLAHLPQITILRSVIESNLHAAHDTRRVFKVKELVYPGDARKDVVGKWIYIIYAGDRQILAEIHAETATRWRYRLEPNFGDAARAAVIFSRRLNCDRIQLLISLIMPLIRRESSSVQDKSRI